MIVKIGDKREVRTTVKAGQALYTGEESFIFPTVDTEVIQVQVFQYTMPATAASVGPQAGQPEWKIHSYRMPVDKTPSLQLEITPQPLPLSLWQRFRLWLDFVRHHKALARAKVVQR